MTNLTFPIIERIKSRKLKLLNIYVPIIIAISFILGAISINTYGHGKVNNLLTQIFSSIFLVGIFYIIIVNMTIKKFNKIGKFILTSTSIIIDINNKRQEFNFNELTNIKIRFGSYEGEGTSNLYVGTMRFGDGNKNFIEFFNGDKEFKYEFFIAEESWVIMLDKKIQDLQKNKVDIKFINN